MRFTRRRSDRPDPARRRLGAKLEVLEGRQLLTYPGSLYAFSELPPRMIAPPRTITPAVHPAGNAGPRQLSYLDNDGKVISGKDRQGDEYVLTVHGPGSIIVTDATPNDGILGDDIDTIQIVGSDPNLTYVTGQVTTSYRTQESFFAPVDGTTLQEGLGEVYFNRLLATSGVKSIILNGFTLTRTVETPPGFLPNEQTGVFLQDGVGLLQFHDIRAPIDLSTGDQPITVQIGATNTPLARKPTIRLDRIFNTVFDSTADEVLAGPQTAPTVNIIVNGEIRSLEFISSTAEPIDPALQYLLPTVGSTGRTAVRAMAIDNVSVVGTARNVTFSRSEQPFQNGFSGLNRLGTARFGGNADAVGIDVRGDIGRLQFNQGLGSPVGASRSATVYGTPADAIGYPARGLYGGLVRANRIGSVTAGPADVFLQTAQNPNQIQQFRTGSTRYYSRPGQALTNAAIVSATDIGAVHVVGVTQNSEIASGFHYPSYVAGLEPVRAPSRFGPVGVRGDLVDSVYAATVRPVDGIYGNGNDQLGRGRMVGHAESRLIPTNSVNALGNQGAGFFARRKSPQLPPPEPGTRVHGVLIR